jgi:hypothetical protein
MNVINLIKHFIPLAPYIFSYKWPPWVYTSNLQHVPEIRAIIFDRRSSALVLRNGALALLTV